MFPDPAVPIHRPDPGLSSDHALAVRLQSVLETRPGQIPWRPTFGCDLSGLAGQVANKALVAEARWRIEDAIKRWVPEARLGRCSIQVIPTEERLQSGRDVPIAEAALMALGTEAVLAIQLEITTIDGPRVIRATVAP